MARLPTQEEVIGYMTSLSNWGRWGSEDTRGTLNLLTLDVVRGALGVPTLGRQVSLARTIAPGKDEPNAPLHFMISSGDAAPDEGFGGSTDWIGLAFHGRTVTHLDAPSHNFWNGRIYNGASARRVTTVRGAEVGSVEIASAGIVARGILADLPRFRKGARLEPGEAVLSDELSACLEREGVVPRPGDALVVRTGRDTATATPTDAVGHAGLHAECLPWLRGRDISVLVADVPQEVQPSGYDRFVYPLHAVAVVAMGMWLVDNALLEELAAGCAELHRWEFLFLIAPLRLKHATGSPVNPIAVL